MAVKIRLMRVGKTKQPTYRVVVADARSPRDGRILETIGHYGPRNAPSTVEIDGDRALDWLRKGAQPTEQVQKLLTVSGVWATFESEKKGAVDTKLNRRGYKTGRLPAAPPVPEAAPEPVAEVPAPTEVAEETPVPDVADEVPADEAPAADTADEAPAAEAVEAAAEADGEESA
jgi:small subunit ribosomal protein S16